jgi:lipopolysaccharide export system protein LptC
MTSWPLTKVLSAQSHPDRAHPDRAHPEQGYADGPKPGTAAADTGGGFPGKASRGPVPPERTTPEATRTGGYLAIERRGGARRVPTRDGLARRRLMINTSKFVLPAAALLLLSSIALWPEFNGVAGKAGLVMRGLTATIDGARVTNAHYNGVDQRGRPFTVTAASANQRDVDRFDLTVPNADMTLENGTWINVKSKQGVFMRKDQQLDLSDDVVLYRDDGTTMTTASASVEMKAGAASGAEATHVEGPFGTLDATGFTTMDKGAAIQFWGPVQVEMNGVSQ